jgi:hypothetical protein
MERVAVPSPPTARETRPQTLRERIAFKLGIGVWRANQPLKGICSAPQPDRFCGLRAADCHSLGLSFRLESAAPPVYWRSELRKLLPRPIFREWCGTPSVPC